MMAPEVRINVAFGIEIGDCKGARKAEGLWNADGVQFGKIHRVKLIFCALFCMDVTS